MHLLSLFFTKVNRKYLVPSLDISACCRKMEASSIRFQVSILRYFCYRKFSNLSTLFAVKKEGDIAFLDLHITDFRKHQKMNFIILYVKSSVAQSTNLISTYARYKHTDGFSTRILDVLMDARMLSLVARPPARIWRTMDNAAPIS